MALEATHIKFALDLKEKYKVTNVEKYIVGTLYPDSRYKTGIARELTHPADFLSWKIDELDNFKKGWYMHLLCDKIQGSIIKEKFPEIFYGTIEAGNKYWIELTAVKLLQDLRDVTEFDVKSFLPNVELIENHNGEDKNLLKEFYNIISTAYIDTSLLAFEAYEIKLHALGLPEPLAKKVVNTAKEFSKDPAKLEMVNEIYPEMLRKVLET